MPIRASEPREQRHSSAVAREAAGSASDGAAMMRVRAMLDRARHPTTPQSEADRALALAAREMRRLNIEEELLIERTDAARAADELAQRGASFVVMLTYAANGRYLPMRREWIGRLQSACLFGLSVKGYSAISASQGHRVVFYGVRGNAELAAKAFSRYVARIEELAAAYDAADSSSTNARKARNSFRVGAAEGLLEAFRLEQREERRRVDELEARAEKARRAEAARAAQQAAQQLREREFTAHVLDAFMRGDDPSAPLVIDVDEDEPDFDAAAAEREVAVSRALAARTDAIADSVLALHRVVLGEPRRLPRYVIADFRAYNAGKLAGKRARQEEVDADRE